MRKALTAMLLAGGLAAAVIAPATAQTVRGTEGGDRTWHTDRPVYTVAFTGMEGGSGGPDHDSNPWATQPQRDHQSPGR